MNPGFLLAAAVMTLGLAATLLWALRGATRRTTHKGGLKVLEHAPRHISNMSQIRRALDAADLQYLTEKAGKALSSRVRAERRSVTLLYLSAIHRDFEQALHVARVIAVLSPEVSGTQEYQRLKLTVLFRFRYQLLRLRIIAGNPALPQISALGQMVTSLTCELEAAIASLGERSALAAEIAMQSER